MVPGQTERSMDAIAKSTGPITGRAPKTSARPRRRASGSRTDRGAAKVVLRRLVGGPLDWLALMQVPQAATKPLFQGDPWCIRGESVPASAPKTCLKLRTVSRPCACAVQKLACVPL